MTRNWGIAARMTVLTVIGAGLILAVVLGVSHLNARRLLENELRTRAGQTALATTNRIDALQAGVEKIVQATALTLEHEMPAEPELYRLVRLNVEANPEIMGSAIALAPAPDDGAVAGYLAPYAWRTGTAVATKDLGDGGYDYDTWDWFTQPRDLGRLVWSEPYFDVGGGDTLMVTCSVPVFAGGDRDRFAAVVTVDISLEWLTRLLADLPLGNGHAFVLSQAGAFVSHPVRDLIMKQRIFNVRNEATARIGQRMVDGETGFVPWTSLRTSEAGWLAFAPVRRSGGSLGLVFTKRDIMADVVALNRASAMYGILGIVLLALVIRLISGSITRPLAALEEATRTLGAGDLDTQLPTFTGDDEVTRLAQSFDVMRQNLQQHVEQLRVTTAAKERIESELQVARSIQMGLVPKTFPPFPEREDLDLYALLEPAREIGGDYYDFFMCDDHRLCLAVGDVCGKGMPAALFMAVTRTLLRALQDPNSGPAATLSRLNDELAHDNDASMFVTMFLAIVDLRTGACTFARGGHNPPFLIPADGLVTMLPAIDGPLVGVFEGAAFAEETIVLQPGDTLLVYTDGVTEAINPAEEVFGVERAMAELSRCRDETCEGLVNSMRVAVAEYAAGVDQFDDITMLAFRFLKGTNDPTQ